MLGILIPPRISADIGVDVLGPLGSMKKWYHCMSCSSLETVLAGFPEREHLSYETHSQRPALTYTNLGFSITWVTTPWLLSSPPAALEPLFSAAALSVFIARLPLQGVTAATGAFLLQSKTFRFKNCSRNINSSGLRAALHLGPVTALSLHRDVELKPLSTKAFAFCLFLPFSHFSRNDTVQTGRDFFDISLAKEKQRQVQSLQEDPWQLQKHPRLAAARVQCSHHALSLFTALLKSRGFFVLSAKQKS